MIFIPAIDIRAGKCVMLTQGKIEKETIYSNDPVFMAKLWQAKGAKRLHVVDLDGAFRGTPQHSDCVAQIRAAYNGVIQLGGGIRDLKVVEQLIEKGIDKLILGTLMVYDPELTRKILKKHGKNIIGAIDIVKGKIAIGGWKEVTDRDAVEFVKELKGEGVQEIIVTDVTRDGTLEGPNLEDIKQIIKESGLVVYTSGGIGSMEDIKKIKALENEGLAGAIIGKALYNDAIKYEDLVALNK
ncbi:MAG: 1-(5-phosphoribosyl)-5-[(5-phosphoribosylamino)methylideneamino]imidazole-4-carboxamide isomerase [Elusimicrobia bacterium RIFOXYA2_FULL_39_19]|nr:MAG: 1-(5-phosphoribosyl)-5-[(5-phosphoribosylamino)methylideneamino]imidazole-4-carboxamide isomerase [Elusimicrobia bacterium RIFOXYA2_FULL_39_19]